ncbi:MAG: LamG domain-containing protein [Planctomycetota bacterium]
MVLADIDRLLGEGDYSAAKARADAAPGDPALAASKEVLLAAAKLAGSFADRRARMRRRIEAEVGQEVKVLTASGLRKGELKEATDAGLVLVSKSIINGRVMGTRKLTVPWGDLAPKEQDRLAGDWSPEGADGQIALAAMALMRGEGDSAEQALVIAGDHPLAPHYRVRLLEISAGAADRAAEADWKAIEDRAARELTADSARALLDEIDALEEAHGNTRFAASAAGRIAAARGKAGGALGPVEGLVAHWSFDEVAGRAARDSTGRHHATVVGAAPAPGKLGKALAFDGKASYVELPAAATSGLREFSFSFWVKTAESRRREVYWQRPCMLGQATKGIPSGDMSVGSNGGYISIFHGQDKKDRGHLSTATEIGDGQWHHVAVTRDGSLMTLYVDARVEASLPARGPALNGTAFRVGAQGGLEEAGYHSSGVMDEVRLSQARACGVRGLRPRGGRPGGTRAGLSTGSADRRQLPEDEGQVRAPRDPRKLPRRAGGRRA